MSFNTQHCKNFISGQIDYDIMADAIKNSDCSIVGLNEMRDKGKNGDYDRQTEILSKLTGIENYYFAKAIDIDGYGYGNGILSKIPIISAETIAVPDPKIKNGGRYYETRCLLKAKLSGGITVFVTHFGLNRDEQENAVETVLKNLPEEKCILMGDFNTVLEDDVLLPIRHRMKDAADLFEKEKFSFPSDKPTRKIDYIFVTPDIEILSADIPEIIASDHRPHTAEIKI